MEPVKLAMTNFLSYRQEAVDLSGVSLAALVGDNGAGKSSLLDALTFGLFGESSKGGPRALDNHVTGGESECAVELEFRLGRELYRVVRSRSIARNKSMLEFSIRNGQGWQPLGGKALTDTQAAIEHTLRMDYRTFTASSLILQGQSDSFTADMTDQERKETLARILGLDIWDKLQQAARDRAREAKAAVAELEGRARALREAVAGKAAFAEQIRLDQVALEEATTQAVAAEQEVLALQRQLAQKPLLDQRLAEAGAASVKARAEADRAGREATGAAAEIARLQGLLGRKAEVEEAAAAEEQIAGEVARLDQTAAEYLRLSGEVERLGRLVTDHDRKAEADISRLREAIKGRHAQASTLDKVPCGDDVRDACPLLANAHSAAHEISLLEKQLAAAQTLANPHVRAWQAAVDARNALKYDQPNHQAARATVGDLRRVAQLKAAVDSAQAKSDELARRQAEWEERRRASLQDDEKAARQVYEAAMLLDALRPIAASLADAQRRLNDARLAEAALRTAIGRHEQALAECEKAETALRDLEREMAAGREREATYSLLDQACSKRGGVPALIVENAVPELERLANDLLQRMAGGRFQIRVDTQAEGKSTGTMQEVLRITVADSGVARPYQTYSGAERFLIDLSLRVAISKFLAHRAGAEIRLFVLDEGLGSCDPRNRQAVMDAIQTVAQEFGKVLIITHIEELQDAFPQRIEVRRGAEGSKVRVVA